MNLALAVSNIANYALQAGVLIAAGLLAVRLLRLARPLLFLQLLLGAVLLLPFLQSWYRPVFTVTRAAGGRVLMPAAALERVKAPIAVDWALVTLAILALGVLVRVTWLLFGLMRLRSIRWDARPLADGVAVSTEIAGPVTFGFWRPVILLPPAVLEMPEAARLAVLAHERAHVRRHDWLFALLEELVLCVLWFHPALWWLVGRIRLAREQVVDQEACRAVGSVEVYMEALLRAADVPLPPYLAPAPQFLRRRQLAARVQSLLEESTMSRIRARISYATATLLVAGLTAWVTVQYPLRGAPQIVEAAPDYATVRGAELVHSTRPVYPIAAIRAGVAGPVTVEVTLAANGEVADARVISGAAELRRAALDAVLNWQFRPGGGVAQVVVDFRLPAAPAAGAGGRVNRVASVSIAEDIPAPLAETLRARLLPFVGQPAGGELYSIVKRVDPALGMRTEMVESGGELEMKVFIERMDLVRSVVNVPGRIRVGAGVQAANLISKPEPAYPPLARQARIQGSVRFRVGIGRDGGVIAIEVVSGHPLLIPAAVEAVRQYRYRPTLLNGQPVEVSSEVDVNFSL